MMTAYLLVQGTVTDEDKYGEYRQATIPLIETFGGKHVRGGTVEILEGNAHNPVRFIEAFVDGLDLAAIGFARVGPIAVDASDSMAACCQLGRDP